MAKLKRKAGCSALVRQSKGHRLKKLRSDSHQKRGGARPHRSARNVTEKPAKHTKRNPRRRRERAQPPNLTGGNGGNRGSIPSQFAPLPPVQNASVARSCRTSRISDPAPRTSAIEPRRNPGVRCIRFVRRRSQDRFLRPRI